LIKVAKIIRYLSNRFNGFRWETVETVKVVWTCARHRAKATVLINRDNAAVLINRAKAAILINGDKATMLINGDKAVVLIR